LIYTTGVLEHVTSANFLADVVFTDLDPIRSQAEVWAGILADILTNTSFISSWRIVDPDGVSLYEEAFPAAISGVRSPGAAEVASQSCSMTLTGKGAPAVGLAQGQTRTVTFLGTFDPVNWADFRHDVDDGVIDFGPLRQFLNENEFIGADHYGTKATYRNYMVPQLNAHYQKTYGL
jgi:hypothetical protein